MKRKKKLRVRAAKGAVCLLLLTGACLFLVPVIWMVSTSLKAPSEVMAKPLTVLPQTPQWKNYAEALGYFPFVRYLLNSLCLVGFNLVGALSSSALVGYSFARLRWPGRDAWFAVLLATMILPSTVTMIPQYILFRNFGWLNTYLPLIVPSFAGYGVNIFLLRQFFRTIPMDLSECAKLDGCPELRIFAQIILPLSMPALAIVALFTFMGTWNDFLGPLLYVNDKMAYTLSFGLRTFQMQSGTKWHLMMAASVVAALPTLCIFVLCQRYFIEGITLTGMK